MAMIGGVQRIGFLVGPLIGGALVVPLGLAGPFYLQTVMAIACTVSLLTATGESESPDDAEGPGRTVTLRSTFFDHRRSLATAGMAIIVMQILRSAREAVVPLWGAAIGLTASQVSFLFALTSGVEVVLFYPTGLLMDRKGRKWAAIPCMAMLAVSMAMVPLTSDMSSLTWVVVVMGLANGLGSGINMTLGSDLSPARGRSEFFGLWRLITDTGTASGPLLVAAVTSAASLGAASVLVGGVGVVGVALLWLAVPETLVQRAGGPHGV